MTRLVIEKRKASRKKFLVKFGEIFNLKKNCRCQLIDTLLHFVNTRVCFSKEDIANVQNHIGHLCVYTIYNIIYKQNINIV